ncbi:galactosylceramide sulfotransferase-like [Watersipora subatra]|uniref:galactosylceramide sulfotransferase-like n=1 Tax=Watersipora subatra TaxID=2589382 RepID=UPI00355B85D6
MQTQVHNNFIQYLGFDVHLSNNLTAVKEYIHFIERKFLLVMITEYFDESLVLLRRLMNWSMADIFYKRSNAGQTKSGTVFIGEEKEKLLNLEHNLADQMLYKHFNHSLWVKIEKEQGFKEELEIFKRLNKKVEEFCFSDELQRDKNVRMEVALRSKSIFTIGEEECLAVRIREGKAPDLVETLNNYCTFRKW